IGVGVQILGSEDVFVIHIPRSSASLTALGIDDLFITRLPSYCEMTCSHVKMHGTCPLAPMQIFIFDKVLLVRPRYVHSSRSLQSAGLKRQYLAAIFGGL